MDYRYDENGNRTHLDDSRSSESNSSGGDDRETHSDDGSHEVTTIGEAEDERRVSSDSEDNSDFSDDVELVIGESAQQTIDEPLIAAARPARRAGDGYSGAPLLTAHGAAPLLLHERASPGARGFLDLVRGMPSRQRTVVLVGHLHHGKTSLLRLLLAGAAPVGREDEASRGMSLKSAAVAALVSGRRWQPATHLVTFVDTPGHPDFAAEAAAALRLADAAVLCVDAVESLTRGAAEVLRRAVLQEGLPVVLVITKVDRLMMELKLPPQDAYRKLRLVVDAVNNEIAGCGSDRLVSPNNGTVCFASEKLGFCFTTESFALKYSAEYKSVDPVTLAQKLWGQITFEKSKFIKITNFRQRPTFVSFILEPLYKIVAHSMTGKGHDALSKRLHPLPRDPVTAAREAVQHFCGNAAEEGVDALLNVLPDTTARSSWLLEQYRLQKSVTAEDSAVAIVPLLRCDASAEGANGKSVALVRVLHGTLRRGMRLAVLDEHSSDAEPFYTITAGQLLLRMVEGCVPVDAIHAGQVGLVAGLGTRPGGHLILVGGSAAAPLLHDGEHEMGFPDERAAAWLDEARVAPLQCASPLVHVGLELKDPSRAAQLEEGLQLLVRTSPGLDAHKEETGEFTLTGQGELHLDTALGELRRVLCPGVRLGVSPPFVSFSETVIEAEGLLAVSGSRRAQLGCTAGALDNGLTEAIEYAQLPLFSTVANTHETVPALTGPPLWTALRRYGLDALDAQHIVAAGPDATRGPSLLIDDTLDEERRGASLTAQQLGAVALGFRSAVAAGPLTGDTVRGAALRVVFADVETGARDAAVLSSARTCVKQALLGAMPRLMEPVLAVDITCAADGANRLAEILQMRRGSIIAEEPIAATTLVCVRALVPAMDSFGLETQMRMLSHGEAFPLFSFDRWDIVPGDPFDAAIHVGPLEPARGFQLARDFTLKTRFRKGLPPLLTDFQA